MAIVAITLTPALTRLFPGCPRLLEMEAANVRGLLDALDAQWPGMRDRLSDSFPRIRPHVNIFVDGERSVLETPLRPGARVFIITAISGG
ncbi:MAG TPA: MoaD/ThiS family protein [Stellaceae bacterium]|jgi:sulfur-carrier protein|nr:MoaD/ThiS family protein [Stellaceae bacterium]